MGTKPSGWQGTLTRRAKIQADEAKAAVALGIVPAVKPEAVVATVTSLPTEGLPLHPIADLRQKLDGVAKCVAAAIEELRRRMENPHKLQQMKVRNLVETVRAGMQAVEQGSKFLDMYEKGRARTAQANELGYTEWLDWVFKNPRQLIAMLPTTPDWRRELQQILDEPSPHELLNMGGTSDRKSEGA